MKVQDVILRALSGEMHWFRAAEIGRSWDFTVTHVPGMDPSSYCASR